MDWKIWKYNKLGCLLNSIWYGVIFRRDWFCIGFGEKVIIFMVFIYKKFVILVWIIMVWVMLRIFWLVCFIILFCFKADALVSYCFILLFWYSELNLFNKNFFLRLFRTDWIFVFNFNLIIFLKFLNFVKVCNFWCRKYI